METNRRKFLRKCGAAALIMGSAPLVAACNKVTSQNRRTDFPLLKPILSEQQIAIEKSVLANQDVKKMVREGYGCGEILLKAYIDKHNLHESILDTAVAFKNGFAFRDTCCLYSAAVMIFSLSVRNLSENRDTRYKLCEQKIKKFREWWLERSPLNCEDIYPECKNGFENQYKKVAYIVESIADE